MFLDGLVISMFWSCHGIEIYKMTTILLTEKQAAEYIGMSRSFLSQARMNGQREKRTNAPPFIKIGKAIRYLRQDIDEWIATNRINK